MKVIILYSWLGKVLCGILFYKYPWRKSSTNSNGFLANPTLGSQGCDDDTDYYQTIGPTLWSHSPVCGIMTGKIMNWLHKKILIGDCNASSKELALSRTCPQSRKRQPMLFFSSTIRCVRPSLRRGLKSIRRFELVWVVSVPSSSILSLWRSFIDIEEGFWPIAPSHANSCWWKLSQTWWLEWLVTSDILACSDFFRGLLAIW